MASILTKYSRVDVPQRSEAYLLGVKWSKLWTRQKVRGKKGIGSHEGNRLSLMVDDWIFGTQLAYSNFQPRSTSQVYVKIRHT